MSQLYLGARGDTRTEVGLLGYLILDVFKVNIPETYQRLYSQLRSTSDYKLEIANALVTQADFKVLDQYRSTLQRYYDALIKEVDFLRDNAEAVREVNDWVSQKTHGKIPTLIDSLDASTRLVLLNAIYFKGTWKTQFEPEKTKNRPFYNNGGENSATVPMMNLNTKFPYLNDVNRRVKVLQLPYKGNDVSMLVVLPYERDGVARLKDDLSDPIITEFLDNLAETKVVVSLPKFKLEYSRLLKGDFIQSGVKSLFGNRADLSGITGERNLYVSEIIHKAVIEVNEEGSEAAAVTGVISKMLPLPMLTNEFIADHPFLFYIIHNKSKVILFVGSVDEL